MLLYYITDRTAFPGINAQQESALLHRIAAAAAAGVDYIQLREKDLPPRHLERLACEAVRVARQSSSTTRLLINGRTDVALACDADGVHLPGGEIAASEVRTLWMKCSDRQPVVGVSAHTSVEVRLAASHGADFAVLAPIFEKLQISVKGIGLQSLRDACSGFAVAPDATEYGAGYLPVLALGGLTLENAGACLEAGASGVAGIRLFQTGDVADTVRRLRAIEPADGQAKSAPRG